jgi:hypothetical protein
VVAVGVTRYSTVPLAEVLGLVRIWLIVSPEPLVAPVMLPFIVPIVHAKVLGAEAVKDIAGATPLQVVAVFGVLIFGPGLTETVIG